MCVVLVRGTERSKAVASVSDCRSLDSHTHNFDERDRRDGNRRRLLLDTSVFSSFSFLLDGFESSLFDPEPSAVWAPRRRLPLTVVLIFACAWRADKAKDLPERAFVALSGLLFTAILVYQLSWIIHPRSAFNKASIIHGLLTFRFLLDYDHFNLPLITGIIALSVLSLLLLVRSLRRAEAVNSLEKRIVALWMVYTVAAIAAALLIDQSFSGPAQVQARYQPIFVGAALGAVMVSLLALNSPVLMRPAAVAVLISLSMAQGAAEISATRHWSAFIGDVQMRLSANRGLIPFEATLHTGDRRRDFNWRQMAGSWAVPYLSIILASSNNIESMIGPPADVKFRPLDPEEPDQLPNLRGIDYSAYLQNLAAQKNCQSSIAGRHFVATRPERSVAEDCR